MKRLSFINGALVQRLPTPSTVSGSCILTVMARRKITLRRRSGTGRLPTKATPSPRPISGSCTNEGQGVPQDYAEAIKWFRKAADQDRPDAQYNLGVMYQNSQGVPRDYAEAAKSYHPDAKSP